MWYVSVENLKATWKSIYYISFRLPLLVTVKTQNVRDICRWSVKDSYFWWYNQRYVVCLKLVQSQDTHIDTLTTYSPSVTDQLLKVSMTEIIQSFIGRPKFWSEFNIANLGFDVGFVSGILFLSIASFRGNRFLDYRQEIGEPWRYSWALLNWLLLQL
jgi:hypothetical protein